MDYDQLFWDDIFCKISLSHFKSERKSSEYFAVIELTEIDISAEIQFSYIDKAIERLFFRKEFKNISLVWKKYFVSDAVNQEHLIKKTVNEALSIVQQSPLNGTKVAVLIYGIENTTIYTLVNGETLAERSCYSHLFHTRLHFREGDSYEQTKRIFLFFIESLNSLKSNLKEHCIRTWIYVQNIDNQYAGMVQARRELFEQSGLTPETHFIASTGIEGKYIYPEVSVSMDAYSIPEVKEQQIFYLSGSSNLNPTHEYGVTFERGTAVQYGDRRHIFISGTASIDNKGKIVYPLAIRKQTERTLENIQVLLKEAGSCLDEVTYLIIYLRDIADYKITKNFFTENYPDTPHVILLAPVCRPGWLIEIECMAISSISDKRFADF